MQYLSFGSYVFFVFSGIKSSFYLQKRGWVQTVMELISPLLMMSLIVWGWSKSVEEHFVMEFPVSVTPPIFRDEYLTPRSLLEFCPPQKLLSIQVRIFLGSRSSSNLLFSLNIKFEKFIKLFWVPEKVCVIIFFQLHMYLGRRGLELNLDHAKSFIELSEELSIWWVGLMLLQDLKWDELALAMTLIKEADFMNHTNWMSEMNSTSNMTIDDFLKKEEIFTSAIPLSPVLLSLALKCMDTGTQVSNALTSFSHYRGPLPIPTFDGFVALHKLIRKVLGMSFLEIPFQYLLNVRWCFSCAANLFIYLFFPFLFLLLIEFCHTTIQLVVC